MIVPLVLFTKTWNFEQSKCFARNADLDFQFRSREQTRLRKLQIRRYEYEKRAGGCNLINDRNLIDMKKL